MPDDFKKARDEARGRILVSYHSEDEAYSFDKGADWAYEFRQREIDELWSTDYQTMMQKLEAITKEADALAEVAKLWIADQEGANIDQRVPHRALARWNKLKGSDN